jgi:hypothetical protein
MFFTVKKNLKIGGKYFRPCICYALEDRFLATARELEAKGNAEITEEPVFFQNGAKIDSKKVKKEAKITEKLQKKVKKQQKNEDFVAETEVSEETDGF